jgi:Flp pilus assembly protein TadD
MRPRLLGLALILVSGCQRQTPSTTQNTASPTTRPSSPVEQGRALIEQGQLDQALAKLQEAPSDADSLYYQGVIWAKKAETAPLPTPPPLATPLPRGAEPPAAPEFKPEELSALDLFQKAAAARPDHALAQLGIAELLAPHAVRRYEQEEARKKTARPGRKVPPAPLPEGPDAGPDRVLQAYKAAVKADAHNKQAVEGLIRFAVRVGRLGDAEIGLQELAQLDPERPEPFIRYGDFLVNDKKDPFAAVEQYKQALVWRAEDDATRAKIADIYIAMGIEHWKNEQYGLAESRLREAQKFVTEKNSPQDLKLRDYLNKLKDIRAR